MEKLEDNKNKINIRDIKSPFIIKNIFSFLSEKQKLNMVMYNQQSQKLLVLDIKDYKKISGKYKIGGKNGKGKVYFIGSYKLEFEGEYLNGKEKEKENYYNAILIFEGEYLDGKRNGKGKEYNYYDGKLKFEGGYLNGKKDGKGKEYYYDGKLKFEGEYLNGKRWNGKWKKYNYKDAKLIFEGEYLNGERNGKGKEYYKDGKLLFDGEYLNGNKWNGMERDIIKKIILILK